MTEGSPVVGYARVSTEEQGSEGVGLDVQRHAIRLEAERHGWNLIAIYEDVASGKSLRHRPGLEQALAAIESGEAAGLIVSKLDRLSRSVRDFAGLLERFQRSGWGLVVMDLGVDTSTIMGAAMAQMVSVFAELERKRIGERTREGLARVKERGTKSGKAIGRPRELDPDLRARMTAMHAEGMGYRTIARQLEAEGIITPRGSSRWDPSYIRRAIEAGRKA